jgi:putative Mg2+ transporter-C (MgtC) family protein
MLVTLGTALLVLVPQMSGMDSAALSRVIQGIVTGIGFLGGGAILKLSEEETVKGLTTAATIRVAAGVGIAAGLGRPWSAVLATLTTLLILAAVERIEPLIPQKKDGEKGRPHS